MMVRSVPNCKGTLSHKKYTITYVQSCLIASIFCSLTMLAITKNHALDLFSFYLILLLQLSITCTIMNNELANNTNDMSISYVNKFGVTQFPVRSRP